MAQYLTPFFLCILGNFYHSNLLFMWTKLNDCGKQLTIHSKLREKDDDQVKVYEIIEVEFDQYKLELIDTNDAAIAEKLRQVLNCEQLVRHGFEVEITD